MARITTRKDGWDCLPGQSHGHTAAARVTQGERAAVGGAGTKPLKVADGQRIEGVYRKRLDLVSGWFAVVEKGRQFSLVP